MPQDDPSSYEVLQNQDEQRQSNVLVQLTQIAMKVHHIDELLFWLTHAMMHRFRLQAAQIWANQTYSTGQMLLELRASADNETSLPSSLLVNEHTTQIARWVLNERRATISQSIEGLLPVYQNMLFKRHGLNYLAGYFLSDSALLPPARTIQPNAKEPTPLAMSVLLFSRQFPSESTLLEVPSILSSMLTLAQSRNLLLLPPHRGLLVSPSPAIFKQKTSQFSRLGQLASQLSSLIPHRVEYTDGNPLVDPLLALDKQIRYLYAMIDDTKTVEELCTLMHVEKKEIAEMLKVLIDQQRVRLYARNGQIVDISSLKNFF